MVPKMVFTKGVFNSNMKYQNMTLVYCLLLLGFTIMCQASPGKPPLVEQQTDGYRYRQFANGRTLMTAVFGPDGDMVCCDIQDEEDGKLVSPVMGDLTNMTKLHEECERIEAEQETRNPTSIHSDDSDEGSTFTLVAPGTNYCGAGNRGGELGVLGKADSCCREHDHCPYNIPAFSTRYGLRNSRPHTVSWHECDLRFKICLKMANTTSANVIGTTYFDIVRSPAFFLPTVPPTNSTQAWYSKRRIRY